MRKKINCMAMGLILTMAFTLCGCGAESTVTKEAAGSSKESKKAEVASDSTQAAAPNVFGEDSVLIDDENCLFEVKGAEESEDGYTINVYIENRSDKELAFQTMNESVNGLMVYCGFQPYVSSGSKVYEKMTFENYADHDITEVKEVSFDLRVYDGDYFEDEDLFYDSFSFYPTGEKDPVIYERTKKDTDIVLADTDDYYLAITDSKSDEYYAWRLELYFVNKSDHMIDYKVSDISVNGKATEGYGSDLIDAHKASYTDITWYTEEFEELGITSLDKVEMSIEAYDDTSENYDCILEDTFTAEPKI